VRVGWFGRRDRQRQHPLEQGVEFVKLLPGQIVRTGLGGRHVNPSTAGILPVRIAT
jgi:hypothetical protein